ncbi:MAG: 30S ribosomal protein S20 [FCB group bacterium]|nr:30S ribosomal protein S20 [FCB group bacterium]
MPHHKSCKKRLKTSAKERVRNNAVRTVLRKTMKDARTKLSADEAIDLKQLYSHIDKVWSKGILHKKRASRLKSRLARAAARVSTKSA